jgi:C-terminal processing protease CtpA/Prc
MFLKAQSLTPEGTVLEGYGVKPDITVSLDRGELLNGIDAQVERAVQYIRDNNK